MRWAQNHCVPSPNIPESSIAHPTSDRFRSRVVLLKKEKKCAIKFTVVATVIGHLIFPSSFKQQQ